MKQFTKNTWSCPAIAQPALLPHGPPIQAPTKAVPIPIVVQTTIAKNYLSEHELKRMNLLSDQFLSCWITKYWENTNVYERLDK